MGASDSSCKSCCQTESLLDQLKEAFDKFEYSAKKGKKIFIGRVDIAKQYNFMVNERLPTKEIPNIFVMNAGMYYRYPLDQVVAADMTYENTAGLLHFINRLQYPLLTLESESAIERFLDIVWDVDEKQSPFFKKGVQLLGIHENRLKYKTRVLVFIYDKEEYSSELKLIREAGRLLAQRLSIRLALVTDHKIIRKYK